MKTSKDFFLRILVLSGWLAIALHYSNQGLAGRSQGPSPSWINFGFALVAVAIGIGQLTPALGNSIIYKALISALFLGIIGVVQHYEQFNAISTLAMIVALVLVVWILPLRKKGRLTNE